jgi:hypothetical protein
MLLKLTVSRLSLTAKKEKEMHFADKFHVTYDKVMRKVRLSVKVNEELVMLVEATEAEMEKMIADFRAQQEGE